MGTPGDKKLAEEVVKSETSSSVGGDSDREDQQSYLLQQLLPSVPAMGVTERRPPQAVSLPTFSPQELTHKSHSSLSQSTTIKQEEYHSQLGLEQATIEDYFQQSKFYQGTPEYLPSLYPTLPQKHKTFPSAEQAGPSGLQTPKTKAVISTSVAGGPQKLKKRAKSSPEHTYKAHICHFCQKSFGNAEKLSKHQQTHTGSSPFKCDNCKKTFTSKFKLVRHALIHSERKPFSCSVCDRTFHRKDHLKNHIKVHSPQKEVYMCTKERCKKHYTSFLSYRKHLAIHAAEEGNLTCQICSETFETKEHILFHLKIHAGSRTVKNPSEKKFTCEFCDRRFFTKKDVRRHLVVHTGMRDFLCQFCPQRFGRKDHLVRHIKKSHNAKYKPTETVTTATIKTEIGIEPKTEQAPLEIKSEFSESSISNPETYNPSLVDFGFKNIFEGSFPQFLSHEESTLFLPSTSQQGELRDLGSEILEDIEGPSASQESSLLVRENLETSQVALDEVVLNNPELLQLLEAPGDKNLPLPGFSQTFQSQQPPQGPPD